MLINGWRVDADYLIGRRFTFTNGAAPDITFVSWKCEQGRELLSAHCASGDCQWLPLVGVCQLIKHGVLVESIAAPFTNNRKGGAR